MDPIAIAGLIASSVGSAIGAAWLHVRKGQKALQHTLDNGLGDTLNRIDQRTERMEERQNVQDRRLERLDGRVAELEKERRAK